MVARSGVRSVYLLSDQPAFFVAIIEPAMDQLGLFSRLVRVQRKKCWISKS
jgi:hypothetical protein